MTTTCRFPRPGHGRFDLSCPASSAPAQLFTTNPGHAPRAKSSIPGTTVLHNIPHMLFLLSAWPPPPHTTAHAPKLTAQLSQLFTSSRVGTGSARGFLAATRDNRGHASSRGQGETGQEWSARHAGGERQENEAKEAGHGCVGRHRRLKAAHRRCTVSSKARSRCVFCSAKQAVFSSLTVVWLWPARCLCILYRTASGMLFCIACLALACPISRWCS